MESSIHLLPKKVRFFFYDLFNIFQDSISVSPWPDRSNIDIFYVESEQKFFCQITYVDDIMEGASFAFKYFIIDQRQETLFQLEMVEYRKKTENLNLVKVKLEWIEEFLKYQGEKKQSRKAY